MIWLNLQALHLICWCVEQPRTYLFVFQIHWCLLPEILNTLLKPAQHWLVGHLPLVCWMVLLDSDIQQQLLKVPIQCCENIQPLLLLFCIVDPFLCFIDDIEAFHCSLPCKWYVLSQVKAYIIFFKRIFTFFINFIFALQFFFFALTGDSYFVNPASGTREITLLKDFPNHSLDTLSNSL